MTYKPTGSIIDLFGEAHATPSRTPAPSITSELSTHNIPGLTWHQIYELSRLKSAEAISALKIAISLSESRDQEMAVLLLAKTVKKPEQDILNTTAQLPNIFQISGNMKKIKLLAPGAETPIMTPKQLRDQEKLKERAARKAARELDQARRDTIKTPFNITLHILSNDLVMDISEARQLLSELVRHYGLPLSDRAIRAAAKAKPSSPQAYIRQSIRRMLSDNNLTTTVQDIKAKTAPLPTRQTQFIGWICEADTPSGKIRKKAYRQSSGEIKIIDPEKGEEIPTYEDNPGIHVIF